uniref:Ribosomal RNA-processing protein 4 n=1 Tax=Caenorhabditis tropicalis TaxID=1561998 RepID=A0A1I7SYU9_9PELO
MSYEISGPPLISPWMMLSMSEARTDIDETKIVIPGQPVCDAPQQFMRGHGTYTRDGEIVSSLSGVVQQLNRLLMVKTIKQRYAGEVGDVVVARVVEVQSKRWKCDVTSRLHANLPLGSVLLPGGDFRRKDVEDEEKMSEFLKKGELICAEVQQVQHDGTLMLHTRNNKYGKLQQGIMIKVPPHLIKKSKKHFHTLPYGMAVIIGCNGNVWVTPSLPETTVEEDGSHITEFQKVPQDVRLAMIRVAACIRLLRDYSIAIFLNSLTTCYEMSQPYDIKELSEQDTSSRLAYLIAARLMQEFSSQN